MLPEPLPPENPQPVDLSRFGLSNIRERFVREYIKDCNGAGAARRAGYSSKGAAARGAKLLAIGNVRAAVDELLQQAASAVDITKDTIISELWANHQLARQGNPLLDRYGNPTGQRMRQFAASNKALELIAELCGFKVDRKAITLDITELSVDQLDAAEEKLRGELRLIEGGSPPNSPPTIDGEASIAVEDQALTG